MLTRGLEPRRGASDSGNTIQPCDVQTSASIIAPLHLSGLLLSAARPLLFCARSQSLCNIWITIYETGYSSWVVSVETGLGRSVDHLRDALETFQSCDI